MVPISVIVARKQQPGTAVDRLKARLATRFDAEKDKPRDLRLSQERLAEKLGISPSTLSENMSGESARRGLLHHLDAIADYFNVTPTLLIHRNDTNLIELRGEEYRLVSHLRKLPPAVRENMLLLLDYFSGLLPEEHEQRRLWAQLRALTEARRALVMKTLDDQIADQRRTRREKDTGLAVQESEQKTRRSNAPKAGKNETSGPTGTAGPGAGARTTSGGR